MYINAKYKVLVISAVLLFAAGTITGIITGKTSIKYGTSSGISPILVLFYPSSNFIDTVKLLNSENPLQRLSGYYAYSGSKIIDFDYMQKRFMEEEWPVIKNTIIWAVSQHSNTEEVLNFYNKIFNASDQRNKEFILNYIEKKDSILYNELLEKNKIKR